VLLLLLRLLWSRLWPLLLLLLLLLLLVTSLLLLRLLLLLLLPLTALLRSLLLLLLLLLLSQLLLPKLLYVLCQAFHADCIGPGKDAGHGQLVVCQAATCKAAQSQYEHVPAEFEKTHTFIILHSY
jgi:hypothetical protein